MHLTIAKSNRNKSAEVHSEKIGNLSHNLKPIQKKVRFKDGAQQY